MKTFLHQLPVFCMISLIILNGFKIEYPIWLLYILIAISVIGFILKQLDTKKKGNPIWKKI